MKINDIQDLKYFVSVYQTLSFTVASQRLKVSKVAVAKRITSFEQGLKQKLFRRSTRGLSATPEADQLYLKSLDLLQKIEEFESSLADTTPMEGVIRLTCSNSMAITIMSHLLLEFRKQFLGLRFELISTDSMLDLVEHNIDISIRMGNPRTNTLIGKKLGENELVICASPLYLENSLPINSINDLKNHSVFYMDYHGSSRFVKTKKTIRETIGPAPLSTNDGVIVKDIGLSNHGIIIRSKWSVKKELENGELVQVLQKFQLESMGPIWLLSTAGRLQSARVRAVYDMLEDKLRHYI